MSNGLQKVKKDIKSKILVHARPAALISQTAKSFDCKTTILFKDKTINAQSIMQLVTSGIDKGDLVTLKVGGKDAKMALEVLEAIFKGLTP